MADGQAIEVKGTNPTSGGALGQVVGTGLGLLTASINDNRQKRMNRDIANQNKINQKEMARFNQAMGLDMWEKTGYVGQRRQLENAGLNPGLMYGQAGGGGTTQGGQATPVQGGTPTNPGEIGMGIQSASMMAMLAAQIENTKADTELKKVEAGKKGGVDTANVEANTGLTIQKTQNEKVNNALLQYQEAMMQVETRVKQGTEEDVISAVKLANSQTRQEIQNQVVQNQIQRETAESIIKQLNTATQEQALRIQAQQMGLIKTGAEIENVKRQTQKIITEIGNIITTKHQNWEKLGQGERELIIKEQLMKMQQEMTDFNTSTPEQLKQWTNLIMSVIPIANMGAGSRPIGFK